VGDSQTVRQMDRQTDSSK